MFRIGHLGDFNDLMRLGTRAGVESGLALSGIPIRRSGGRISIETDDKLLDPKESVEHYWVPMEQCLGMIFSGQLADSFTIASLLSFRAIAPDLADKEASIVETH